MTPHSSPGKVRPDLGFPLAVLAIMAVLDVWTTSAGLRLGAEELNPFARHIVALGVPAMLAAKAIVWTALALARCRLQPVAVWFALAITSAAVLNNSFQLLRAT